MSTARPRLAVICVDGATPRFAGQLGLFRSPSGRDAAAVRTVYPSSTAPAHASILTGRQPAMHGIVGNRYWETESVREILSRQSPLGSLHPYDRFSLRSRSLLDDILGASMSVGAVLFPHAFSRQLRHPGLESCYCLYAPARTWTLAAAARTAPGEAVNGTAREQALFEFRDFGERLVFAATPVNRYPRPAVRLTCREQSWELCRGDCTDIIIPVSQEKAICFALTLDAVDDREIVLRQATAVLVIGAGHWPAGEWVAQLPAHSRSIDYTAGSPGDFYESPSIEWVTSSALKLLSDGRDVLFVRYNQVDHAQEHLYWQVRHGSPDVAALARAEIATAYRRVAAGIAEIAAAAGPECFLAVCSDHGIDYIDTHIRPNQIITGLGLASEFIFQGDSNVCYLYGERPLTRQELDEFSHRVDRAGHGKLRILPRAELDRRGTLCDHRCGLLALESAEHAEFQYGDGALIQEAESASHGFDPRLPSMDGIWQVIQGPDLPAPRAVTGIAGLLGTMLAGWER